MYFHWQNLNEKPGGRLGLALRHGRAWWNFRYTRGRRDDEDDREHRGRAEVRLEWSLMQRQSSWGLGLTFERGDGVGFQASIALPLLALYLTVHGGWAERLALRLLPSDGYEDRDLSLKFFDKAVWWHAWVDDNSWSRKRPRWRDGSLHYVDALLGRRVYSSRLLREERASVPLPEGPYPCTVTLTEDTWRRPRWPFSERLTRAEVRLDHPAPIPGKGESSWDCGEDSRYSCSGMQQSTVYGALLEFTMDVIRTRWERGGPGWVPTQRAGSPAPRPTS